ncbi:hypothetical protein [Caulobacter sp. 17J80-11]|uniref:hypothetical protein n=1 Tax=Caulobacter sp. 17J80-11 TaxID=2763502 RepID=UPI001653EA08|nr:hypothetical protein [Caulobacter sp. 17J80-11]MBC6981398.1 hypothetical protein [Caulobacter sp. 17J80-11]
MIGEGFSINSLLMAGLGLLVVIVVQLWAVLDRLRKLWDQQAYIIGRTLPEIEPDAEEA